MLRLVLAQLALLLGLSACDRPVTTARRIALIASLSGPTADPFSSEEAAAKLAVDEINGNGGVAGRPLELDVRDDRGQPSVGVDAYRAVEDEGVVGIIGPSRASIVEAVAGSSAIRVPTLVTSTSAGHPPNGQSLLFWVTTKMDFFQAGAAADELLPSCSGTGCGNREKLYRAAVIHCDDVGSRDVATRFQTHYEKKGGSVVGVARYPELPSYAGFDFDPVATAALAGDSQAVFLVTGAEDGALITRALRKRIAAGQSLRLVGWELNHRSSFAAAADPVMVAGMTGVAPAASRSQELTAFLSRFAARFSTPPSYAATAIYDAVYLLAHAIQRSTAAAPDEVARLLVDVSNPPGDRVPSGSWTAQSPPADIDFAGASGPVDWSASREPRQNNTLLRGWRIVAGKIVDEE
jgi:branched-chain amino acid transport system substrate-binding protein